MTPFSMYNTIKQRNFNVQLIVFPILIFTFLSSCMPIMKLAYGLHDPKYLSDEQALKYAERIGLEGPAYRLTDYNEANRKKYQYLGNTMPEVLIFNTKGQQVRFEIDCSSSLDSIVKLPNESIDQMNTTGKMISDLMTDSYTLNEQLGMDTAANQSLYVLKFGEFAGQLNKDFLPSLITTLKSRNDVQYILLNMDYTSKNEKRKEKSEK